MRIHKKYFTNQESIGGGRQSCSVEDHIEMHTLLFFCTH